MQNLLPTQQFFVEQVSMCATLPYTLNPKTKNDLVVCPALVVTQVSLQRKYVAHTQRL